MSNAITKKQQAVFDFLKSHIDENGFPPTCLEISKAFGWASENAAHTHLKALQAKGFIKIARDTPRGIKVCNLPKRADQEKAELALLTIRLFAARDDLSTAEILALCDWALA